jgi:hypothetical protein
MSIFGFYFAVGIVVGLIPSILFLILEDRNE